MEVLVEIRQLHWRARIYNAQQIQKVTERRLLPRVADTMSRDR